MQVIPPHLWPFYLISYMDRLKSHSRMNWNNLLMAISHCFIEHASAERGGMEGRDT